MEKALAIVKAEEERADHRSVRGIAEASHHTVDGALALDLLHAGAITRAILEIDALGHHPIEGAARHGEPLPRRGDLGRGGRETETLDALQLVGREGLETPPALAERQLHEHASAAIHEEVEDHELSGMLAGKLLHAARRRVNTLEQIVEGEAAVHRHDDLAVEHESSSVHRAERLRHLREVAGERLTGLGLELDRAALAEGDAAESVPLRFVGPLRPFG